MGSNPSTAYFHIMCISLQQAEITNEVLIGRFSSSAVVHSASYCPGMANSSVLVVVLRG